MPQARLTVHDMAVEIRRHAIKDYGEDEWARWCIWFDQELPAATGNDERQQLAAVYAILARDLDARDTQLALCWLDGRGFGATTLEDLKHRLADFRNTNPS